VRLRCVRQRQKRHAQERLELHLELGGHHHVQLQDGRRRRRQNRRAPARRHGEHGAAQVIAHQP